MAEEDYYVFVYYLAEIGLCRRGRETVFSERCQSFLLDNDVTGIAIRMKIFRSYSETEGEKVRKRLVLYKESDCKEFANARHRYEEWEQKDGNVSSCIKINDTFSRQVQEMYKQSYLEATEAFKDKGICQAEIEYSMPLGVEEEHATFVLPVDPNIIEANTVYRVALLDIDEISSYYGDWPWALFFRYDKPIKKAFVPLSASLRVRKKVRNELLFKGAARYRNYKDFYGDEHYDDICEEVEVNPLLVCFEVRLNELLGEYVPLSKIEYTSDDTVLERGASGAFFLDNKTLLVYRPFGEDFASLHKKHITATLSIFDVPIARFTFETTKSELGEYTRQEIEIVE